MISIVDFWVKAIEVAVWCIPAMLTGVIVALIYSFIYDCRMENKLYFFVYRVVTPVAIVGYLAYALYSFTTGVDTGIYKCITIIVVIHLIDKIEKGEEILNVLVLGLDRMTVNSYQSNLRVKRKFKKTKINN